MNCSIGLITFFLFFNSLMLSAQKPPDYSLKHSMKQDGLSMQFTVLDPDKKGVSHYDETKTYYWFKAQHVLGTQGGSSGQLLHGLFESFYASKQLYSKGYFTRGLKDGDWFYWREDGSLLRSEHWNAGTPRGEQIDYSENGIVRKRTVIHGKTITTETADTLIEIRRRTRTVTISDSIGQTRSIARYRNQLLHGKQVVFDTDTSETVTVYKNGLPVEKKNRKEQTQKNGRGEREPGFVARTWRKVAGKNKEAGEHPRKDRKKNGDQAPSSGKEKTQRKKFSLKKNRQQTEGRTARKSGKTKKTPKE